MFQFGSLLLLAAQIAIAGQERFTQPIIVNGQQAQGIIVVQNGAVQTHTCPSPQQYVSADQSSSGWACFDSSTGTWLLHALPPTQAAPPAQATYVYEQPQVYVSSAAVPVYPYGYPYAYPFYGYYPYTYYPYFAGPRFGFGFSFGRRPIVIGRSAPVVIRGGRGFVTSRPFGGFGGVRSGRSFGRGGRIGHR